MRYIPCSETDRKSLLASMGCESVEELFSGIPESLRLRRLLNIPAALSEPELLAYFQRAADENAENYTSFLGAGVYRHFIPVVVDSLISRSEFYTAYTPYQAEVSQGTLQAIFEFQTYITQLTGQEVANASLYDGSTAITEAILMAHRITKRNKFLVAKTVHPEYRAVMATYSRNLGLEVQPIDYLQNGRVDLSQLEKALDDTIAGVVIQSPNFFGTIEDTAAAASLAARHGALSIVNVCEALSMGILSPPQADIVAGEAQSLGVPMSFGGPHVGFLATREKFVRQMPGRLVGMGVDQEGRRAFVLTLATREQHIRRERATSNICTNQSLCALMATIYMATLGPRGLREAGEQNIRKTDYAVTQIQKLTAHKVLFPSPRFNEFVLQLQDGGADLILKLLQRNIVPGFHLRHAFPDLGDALLICVTETTTREQIDALVEGLK
jgi:glycine cleavage system P protein (glycine dehydrogenase) subunit 1